MLNKIENIVHFNNWQDLNKFPLHAINNSFFHLLFHVHIDNFFHRTNVVRLNHTRKNEMKLHHFLSNKVFFIHNLAVRLYLSLKSS